jgi:fructan beta-fructosidase
MFGLLGLVCWGLALAAPGGVPRETAALYAEPYRPQYHYSPPRQWMNDPNGMVYFAGEYQLFYQYNPYDNRWGPMHWGHAVSRDLVHWETLPIALFPDNHGTIFSGSAVLDADNTSGLGSLSEPPLVAIFTYNALPSELAGHEVLQSQGLAYSRDRGRTWTAYAGNPVLANSSSHDFRDPKVFWSVAAKKWVMTLAVHDHVSFYSSPDLKSWTRESDFGQEYGAHGGVWECPDLIELPVSGSGERKAVLLVSINPGGPNGGSATQYFVGRFDGHRFAPDADVATGAAAAAWVDFGTDDYAGSTWSGHAPGDERELFIGWMSNWQYANMVPTERWRSAFTVPRELSLVKAATRLELHSWPVAELASLRTGSATVRGRTVSQDVDLSSPESATGLYQLDLSLSTRRATRIELVFSNEREQRTVFRINKTAHQYEVDRRASGAVDFSAAFASLQTAPLPPDDGRVTITALIDRSSVELFIDHGATVFTTLVFPSTPYAKIRLQADAPMRVERSTVFGLKSIWPHPSSNRE